MKIKHLQVQTTNLEKQFQFYKDSLKLDVLEKNERLFVVKIGYSVLEFHQTENSTPYHMAFHIHTHRQNKALAWLKKRVNIIKDEGKEIVDFPAWNAKSIYFYDVDHNVLEFIAREQLPASGANFSEKNIMGIAEIGLATDAVKENFELLNQYFKLELYFGTPDDTFCAIGDENGLLIAADSSKKTWFPTLDKASPADFDLKFERQGKVFELNYEDGKLSLM